MFFLLRQDTHEVFSLTDSETSLGRETVCSVCLPSSDVSRHHAKILFADGQYTLHDLGSLNGTFVNEQRIESQSIVPGDQIRLGSVSFLFCSDEGEKQPLEKSFSLHDSQLDITMGATDDQAKILRTMSHAEGQKFLTARQNIPTEASWTLRAQGYLQLLYDMTLSLGHCTDVERMTSELLELIFRWIDADRGCILLLDPVTNQLEPKAKKIREHVPELRMTISRTILDYVLDRREGVLTSDATQDERWDHAASVMSACVHEAICVPLQGQYGMVGAIYLDTFSRPDWVSLTTTTHRLGDEHLKLMITIAHHIAVAIEDTRFYSSMLQAERLAAIGQTVATLSHHIKNILQGIQGGSYLIESGLKQHNEEFISKGWQIVERNQNRISSLVLDMLTFSKERKPEWTEGNLNTIGAEVVELMQARATHVGAVLVWEPDTTLPNTRFDPEAIHHAVLNLVTNALDAIAEEEPRGTVRVSTQYDAENVAILVEDNGPGLTEGQIEDVFKLFASTKGNRGTGLGLPVCQKIIHEHAGTIRVESCDPHGCRFVITLPRSPRPQPE